MENLKPTMNDSEQLQPAVNQRELTFGEKLVGLTFNPSGDAKVDKAKKLFAEAADLLNVEYRALPSQTALQAVIFHHSIGSILDAQMNTVKYLTLKY